MSLHEGSLFGWKKAESAVARDSHVPKGSLQLKLVCKDAFSGFVCISKFWKDFQHHRLTCVSCGVPTENLEPLVGKQFADSGKPLIQIAGIHPGAIGLRQDLFQLLIRTLVWSGGMLTPPRLNWRHHNLPPPP